MLQVYDWQCICADIGGKGGGGGGDCSFTFWKGGKSLSFFTTFRVSYRMFLRGKAVIQGQGSKSSLCHNG